MRQLVFGIGSAELLLSSLLIGGVILATGSSWQTATALGLALALSSTALVLPMVGTQSPVGRASFSMLLFEAVMLVPIIVALGVLGPLGGGADLDSLFRVRWVGGETVLALLLLGRRVWPRLCRQPAGTH